MSRRPAPSPSSADLLRVELARFIALGYPGAPVEPETGEAWVMLMQEDLDDVAPLDLVAAFRAYRRSDAKEDRFMPTPGRIRALAPAMVALGEARGMVDAAWRSVLVASSDTSKAGERVFTPRVWIGAPPTDEVRRAVLDGVSACGGWFVIGHTEHADRVLGKAFAAGYTASLARAASPERPVPASPRLLA